MYCKPFYYLIILALGFSCKNSQKETIPEAPIGWSLLETGQRISIRALSPLTEDIAWAAGTNGIWLRTLDRGTTWQSGVIAGLDTVDFRDIEANKRQYLGFRAGWKNCKAGILTIDNQCR